MFSLLLHKIGNILSIFISNNRRHCAIKIKQSDSEIILNDTNKRDLFFRSCGRDKGMGAMEHVLLMLILIYVPPLCKSLCLFEEWRNYASLCYISYNAVPAPRRSSNTNTWHRLGQLGCNKSVHPLTHCHVLIYSSEDYMPCEHD